MIKRNIEINKPEDIVRFSLEVPLRDVYGHPDILKYFIEMSRPETKVSDCLDIMTTMFELIEKNNETNN